LSIRLVNNLKENKSFEKPCQTDFLLYFYLLSKLTKFSA
jgi:hypothetical protein